jgi:hypothetical protein
VAQEALPGGHWVQHLVACAFNGLVAHEALTRQALGATVRVAGAPAGGEAHVFT